MTMFLRSATRPRKLSTSCTIPRGRRHAGRGQRGNEDLVELLQQQKRDALRMLHTPRTTFLFAVKQGVGFVPVPGLGEGIASLEALLADPGMSGRAGAVLMLGRERDSETLHALIER